MILDAIKTHESKAHPGVTFRVKQLNQLERAKRDASLLQHQQRLAELLGEYRSMEMERPDPEDDSKVQRYIPEGDAKEAARLSAEMDSIIAVHLKPQIIRYGLAGIDGVTTTDGKQATVDEVLSFAPDSLLDEIFEACTAGAGLTSEQQKN
jgi:hypothetical protein